MPLHKLVSNADKLRVRVQEFVLENSGMEYPNLKKILCPYGEFPFHNVEHMTMVSSNAVQLSEQYQLSRTTKYSLAAAGLFHDAGRLPIRDELNIENAVAIAKRFIPVPEQIIDRITKFIRASEFSEEATARLAEEGTISELILRDADFLVWANDLDTQNRLFKQLSEETGEEVTQESTASFLNEVGVFLPESQERLAKAGFTVPLLPSNVLSSNNFNE